MKEVKLAVKDYTNVIRTPLRYVNTVEVDGVIIHEITGVGYPCANTINGHHFVCVDGYDGNGFVLGHEIGHVVNGDTTRSKKRRELSREVRADVWSARHNGLTGVKAFTAIASTVRGGEGLIRAIAVALLTLIGE